MPDHNCCPSHCCQKHGCKYCEPDCPVVLGLDPGIKCEDCFSDDYYRLECRKQYVANIINARIKIIKAILGKS